MNGRTAEQSRLRRSHVRARPGAWRVNAFLGIAQPPEGSSAVAEPLHGHAQLLEQREMQVRQGRPVREANVAAAADVALAANQRDWQLIVEMGVAVADRAAVEEQRV